MSLTEKVKNNRKIYNKTKQKMKRLRKESDVHVIHEDNGEESIYSNTGKWKRGRLLGRGYGGSVYLAEMIKPPPPITSRLNGSHPIMAVKSTLASHGDDLKKEKKFLQLFVDSPYIVRCFGDDMTITTDDQGNKTKLYNVLLEYASGGCLADFMEGTILSETQVRQHTKSILRGLECIHDKGVVHCDLKPENILMVKEEDDDDEFVAKISDFGLSKMADDWMITPNTFTIVKGTRVYWAPECVQDEVQEKCSDVWALGCIVLYMLMGGRLKWNNKVSESVSKEAKDFLIKCFEADPLQRPSAKVLLSHPFVGGSGVFVEREEDRVVPKRKKMKTYY
ncbi:mitogen-activated protein kinase kinase kinase 20-like [Humulus lupulus]|uniref:mitogen-activated protein kinase kinase kinase 20-like n=1 Tax=Humulus lupulus TaxID=3486 RepID=UPI002B4078B5|nr:mitogen-activated protein kinase kinase kinase 20-like [Humulus lupulus]